MSLGSDVRLTMRGLRRHLGYAAATIGTLALGIGATTAIFSAVYAVALAPQPIRDPSRLIVGWGVAPERSHGLVELTYRDIEALGRDSRTVQSMSAVGSTTWTAVLEGNGDPVRIGYAGVSGTFFETLGVRAALGRALQPADDQPGGANVVVISHAMWRDRFGSSPRIVGERVTIDGEPQEIVGVMPSGFDYPRGAEFWSPLAPGLAVASATWKTDVLANVGVLFYVGRLRHDARVDTAGAELSSIGRRLDEGRPSPQVGSSVAAVSFATHVVGPAQRALWALAGAVAVLLLIACVNVSGLMLTRAADTRRVHAIHMALGASHTRVARLWALESLVVAGAGGVLGVVMAAGLTSAMLALAPEGIPRLGDARVNGPVALLAFAVSAIAAAACGLAPMRSARATHLTEMLAAAGRHATDGRPRRGRYSLLVSQVALAVVLLVTAGLVTRSFQALRAVDLGFQPADVVSLQVDPRLPATSVNAWVDQLLTSLQGKDAIASAGAIALRPLGLGPIGQGTTVVLEGQPDTAETTAANPLLNYQVATPEYFRAMRIPLLAGRVFTADDRTEVERVAIVGASTAQRLWPGREAVGQRLLTASFDRRDGAPRQAWRRVVGVVADVRYRGLGEVSLDLYDPAAQSTQPATDLVIRARGNPIAAAAVVAATARQLTPAVVIDGVTTMDALVAQASVPWRFSAWVFSLFAGVATTLTAIGLFSVVALDVAARRREFAVRLAVGATPAAIGRRVASGAGVVAGVGLTMGLGAAMVASAAVDGLLFQVPRLDIVTYAAVTSGVAVVIVAASWLPVRRAMRVAPADVLREY